MNISLSPELENAVQRKVASGEYAAIDDLIGEAVQRLIDEDLEERLHTNEIRLKIDVANEEIERGAYVDYEADALHDLVKDVRERGMNRLASE